MITTVIGLFKNTDTADKVVNKLTKSGFKKNAIEILQDVAASKVSSRLVEAGYGKDDAEKYSQAMQKGVALVIAEAAEDKVEDALSTMRSFEALTPEELMEMLDNQSSSDTETAQVIEEELEVGVSRTTGGKRLKTEVSEHEVQETISIHEEKVDVEHTKVDRVLKPEEADKAFQGQTVEMVEISEKPIVSKQAHVVEEIALSKQSGEREVTVSGTVRHQDVTVEDIDSKSAKSKAS